MQGAGRQGQAVKGNREQRGHMDTGHAARMVVVIMEEVRLSKGQGMSAGSTLAAWVRTCRVTRTQGVQHRVHQETPNGAAPQPGPSVLPAAREGTWSSPKG